MRGGSGPGTTREKGSSLWENPYLDTKKEERDPKLSFRSNYERKRGEAARRKKGTRWEEKSLPSKNICPSLEKKKRVLIKDQKKKKKTDGSDPLTKNRRPARLMMGKPPSLFEKIIRSNFLAPEKGSMAR